MTERDDDEWKFSVEDVDDGRERRDANQQAAAEAVRRQRAQAREPEGYEVAGLAFTPRELMDFVVAWISLGIAFTAFGWPELFGGRLVVGVAVSLLTVGVGFLLHELAHKVVAVRFGQIAHFRADYGMLLLAIIAGFAGFLFAAPGAVYHRGQITKRQNGLIALAGPATNVALTFAFAPFVLLPGPLFLVGALGTTVNAVLAAFNMLPFGPLDGNTVRKWSWGVYLPAFLAMLALAVVVVDRFFGVFGIV